MSIIKTIQFRDSDDLPRVGYVDGNIIRVIKAPRTTYDLAMIALENKTSLAETILSHCSDRTENYDRLIDEGRILPPVSHPVSPSLFLLSGTGLTHIGSARARNAMHHEADATEMPKSDAMRLFEQGLEKGKPAEGKIGAMPEWFYKGDASCLINPGAQMTSPNFALSCAEEPEITGIYIIDQAGTPHRLGFTVSNDLSDHETESLNFMYIAPSKLRDCAMGPELLIGDLPDSVCGWSRIIRHGKTVWEGKFESGDAHMSYSIANLEHHHFRYSQFRRPGDLHAHFFGCPVMSFGEGFRTQSGDIFEFDIPVFGRPLRNAIIFENDVPQPVKVNRL